MFWVRYKVEKLSKYVNVDYLNNNNLNINLKGKFTTERGRINCSLREKNGFYRWLGVQFVVKEK